MAPNRRILDSNTLVKTDFLLCYFGKQKQMNERRKISRWLTMTALIQLILIFMANVIFTWRLRATGSGLRDSLRAAGVGVEQVDQVNQAFTSISNDIHWLFLGGVVLTSVGFGWLRRIVNTAFQKGTPPPDQKV